jgi:hypothetical protein
MSAPTTRTCSCTEDCPEDFKDDIFCWFYVVQLNIATRKIALYGHRLEQGPKKYYVFQYDFCTEPYANGTRNAYYLKGS